MAYKQKSRDLKNVANVMSNNDNYGPGDENKIQSSKESSKDLTAEKVLKLTKGGEEAMAAAYTKQTGSTLYSGPLYESFKNTFARDLIKKRGT
jgi:hypothetical protein